MLLFFLTLFPSTLENNKSWDGSVLATGPSIKSMESVKWFGLNSLRVLSILFFIPKEVSWVLKELKLSTKNPVFSLLAPSESGIYIFAVFVSRIERAVWNSRFFILLSNARMSDMRYLLYSKNSIDACCGLYKYGGNSTVATSKASSILIGLSGFSEGVP